MQNFKANKHSDSIKWIAITLAILLLGVAVAAAITQGFTDANPYGWLDKTIETEPQEQAENEEKEGQETGDNIEVSVVEEKGVLLSAGEAFASADGDAYSKILTATVLPNDAPDKSVDWSLAWCEDATLGDKSIEEYITLHPNSDGSNVATITCKKAFYGDFIIVTCKTRIGGFTATCSIEYKGIPDSFAISTTGGTAVRDSSWNLDMVEFNCGQTYNLDLVLDNAIHDVGSEYGNYTLTLEVFGSVVFDHIAYNSNNEVTSTTTTTMSPITGTKTNGYESAYIQTGSTYTDLLSIKIENKKLVLIPGDAVTSLSYTNYGRGGYAIGTYKNCVDNKMVYYKITVTDTTTGLSQVINVKTKASVKSVSLTQTSLQF